jgi:RNA polymerase sigma-70 factor (ECF subfamily)
MRPVVPETRSGPPEPSRAARSEGPPPREAHAADLALVEGALRGDPGAEREFVERMRCARRFLVYKNASFGRPLGPHELEDAVQSTLLAVWRKLGDYAGIGSLESWVHGFAFLELMHRLQALDRRPRELDPTDETSVPAVEREPRPDPLERERLYRHLGRLDADAAALIRGKHFEGYTFEELAATLAIPVNTAKTRYYRGMERLRQLLRDPRAAGGGLP